MTPETKQRYLTGATILTAIAEGKTVQYRMPPSTDWKDYYSPVTPDLLGDQYEWRIKPTPTVRPWTAKDVPPVCWLRRKHGADGVATPTVITHSGVQNFLGKSTYEELFRDYEWSPTPQGPFQPCTTTEP